LILQTSSHWQAVLILSSSTIKNCGSIAIS
jgi:hypothetical protein